MRTEVLRNYNRRLGDAITALHIAIWHEVNHSRLYGREFNGVIESIRSETKEVIKISKAKVKKAAKKRGAAI